MNRFFLKIARRIALYRLRRLTNWFLKDPFKRAEFFAARFMEITDQIEEINEEIKQ